MEQKKKRFYKVVLSNGESKEYEFDEGYSVFLNHLREIGAFEKNDLIGWWSEYVLGKSGSFEMANPETVAYFESLKIV